MKSVGPRVIRDVLLLSFAAGGADAAGYMGLGHIFTSNMTGNVVLLGIAIGQGHLAQAARTFYVLAVFMAGAALGTQLGRGLEEKDKPRLILRLIGLEAALLVLFALGWFFAGEARHTFAWGLLTLLSLAMGLQSAAMYQLSVPGVATTAVTSTLTALVSGIMKLFTSPPAVVAEDGPARMRVEFQALVLCLYCGGAELSALLMMHAERLVGCPPMILVGAVVLLRGLALRRKL
jgi:uncharacterized membrane protein YoaK (UPF0700 family)